MLESEARQHWCVWAKPDNPPPSSPTFEPGPPIDGSPLTFNCVASQCMQWRWTAGIQVSDDDDGYCGVAVKPHDAA